METRDKFNNDAYIGDPRIRITDWLGLLVYYIIGYIFFIISAGIILLSVWNIILLFRDLLLGFTNSIPDLVHNSVKIIDHLIVAIVLADVGDYLINVKKNHTQTPRLRIGQNLTQFILIIVVALILDALLNTLLVEEVNMQLIYPGISFFAAIALLIGLGVYNKLSVSTEKEEQIISRKAP